MSISEDQIQKDVRLVGALSIIQPMLQVICHATGMGFAAVAKVTADRWIACGVRDQINFGLRAGEELAVRSTICDEIRDSGRAVIIDHVAEDGRFCNHHTALQYGFQSYISIPVFFKGGEFFGTLCAIDPRPAKLNNPETISLFTLLAELLSFHITALQEVKHLRMDQKTAKNELGNYKDELNQYRHLSHHTLQEPLRKIRVFSDQLAHSATHQELEKVKQTAQRINYLATDLSGILHDITDYNSLDLSNAIFSTVPLGDTFQKTLQSLSVDVHNTALDIDLPHTVTAIPGLVQQLFMILIAESLKRSATTTPLHIAVRSVGLSPEEVMAHTYLHTEKDYCRIIYQDNTPPVGHYDREKMFDIALRQPGGLDAQLAQARKIVRLHGGIITPGEGTTLEVVLPI